MRPRRRSAPQRDHTVQGHFDGCFNYKHLANSGRRDDEHTHDARVPAAIFLTDAERDHRDSDIAKDLHIQRSECRACNDFTADPKESRCASHSNVPLLTPHRRACCSQASSFDECSECRASAAKTDRKGFFGYVCDHMILHCAVMLVRGENWRAAVLLLQKMLQEGSCPAIAFYDINCKWETEFLQWLLKQDSLAPDVVAAARQMMLPLPPFHAAMHIMSCREVCSVHNRRFAAWCSPCGEPAEQYWALLGACQRLKYMTKHYAKLFLDRMAVYLNKRHSASLARLLLQRVQKLSEAEATTAAQIELMRAEDATTGTQVS